MMSVEKRIHCFLQNLRTCLWPEDLNELRYTYLIPKMNYKALNCECFQHTTIIEQNKTNIDYKYKRNRRPRVNRTSWARGQECEILYQGKPTLSNREKESEKMYWWRGRITKTTFRKWLKFRGDPGLSQNISKLFPSNELSHVQFEIVHSDQLLNAA